MTTPPLTASPAERREFFRVEDRLLLACRIVERAAIGDATADSHFDNGEVFRLMRELRAMDGEHSSLLRSVTEQNRELGACLKSINRKLELIAGTLAALHPDSDDPAPQSVSLSESSIAFTPQQPLPLGTVVALQLTLLPQHVGLALYGEVVANRDDKPERAVVNFIDLRDSERQVLARHTLQVQIAARRQRQ